ncbi:MAG: lamin tail domain-containing protein, partial [Bdellovibrionales bacterium]|nr:lamin tail domain-containing protein [Bdellovibrionales bacterium]
MAIPIAVGIATPTHAIPKAFGRAEKSVVFQEVFYDSPLTEDSNLGMPLEPEIYQGEYILLWNSSDERIDLSGWTVENEESSETKHLSGYLDPGERMLLANSDDGDLDHFYAATQLPLTIINDSTFIKV